MALKLLLNNANQQAAIKKFFWIGYIPYDETGENGWSDFSKDIENFNKRLLDVTVNAETAVKFDEKNFPDSLSLYLNGEGEYFYALVPEGYTLMIDNGVGTPTPISESNGFLPLNDMPIGLMNGVQYYLYGFMGIAPGNRVFYLYAN